MPKPNERSRSKKKVFVRTPGGVTTVHYRKKKVSKSVCGTCGATLHGVPNKRPSKLRNLPKTVKRPERPYGGNLCSSCTRKLLVQKARA
ncbi:50S ribosomal protein L34e [Candidatus Woesearchaeota archaeon]|nr:MAG: 50S ribosomal protein L34e [Candidatus Woesearchaeota archaeon]